MSNDRQKRIEQRAYEIWDREGRRSGMDAENWQQAEAEIAWEEEAETSAAKPAEPEPPIKSKPEAKDKTKPEAKPAEPVAASQVRKSGGKTKASGEEPEEKAPRKRKAPIKKK